MNICMYTYIYIYIYIYIYKNEALSKMYTGFFWHAYKASLLWRLRLTAEPFPPCPINTGVFVRWMQSFWNMYQGFFTLPICIAMCFHIYACACACRFMLSMSYTYRALCVVYRVSFWYTSRTLGVSMCVCVCIYICMYTYRIYMHICIGM